MNYAKLLLKVCVLIYLISCVELKDSEGNNDQNKDASATNNINKQINVEKSNVSISLVNTDKTVQELSTTVSPPPGSSVRRVLNPSKEPPLAPSATKKTFAGDSSKVNDVTLVDPMEDALNFDSIDNTDEDTNKTLANHNITKVEEEHHEYYNSTTIVNKGENLYKTYIYADCPEAIVSDLLSRSHRRAMTVKLPFEFPFYGYPLTNITIATGGFLYAGDYIHSWLAATQYIAPLMANFDTSISNDSFVKYCEKADSFHVYWERVHLQNRSVMGPFTFSASLYSNGNITFNYYSLPVAIQKIEDNKHPVKVGISDAYIIDNTVFHARRKTIYEYHRVNFENLDIRNNTQIQLVALPTCLSFTTCTDCLQARETNNLQCSWCPSLRRCSSGLDRRRQEWMTHGCNRSLIQDIKGCAAVLDYSTTTQTPVSVTNSVVSSEKEQSEYIVQEHHEKAMDNDEHPKNVGLLTSLCVIMGLIFTIGIWLVYSYLNPLSKSGQLLIKYRPWAWHRRGEARYTAASIHM